MTAAGGDRLEASQRVSHVKRWLEDSPDGSVATFMRQQTRCRSSVNALDRNGKQPCDELELADNLTDAHPLCLPLPNRMHRFVTLDRSVPFVMYHQSNGRPANDLRPSLGRAEYRALQVVPNPHDFLAPLPPDVAVGGHGSLLRACR